MRVIAQQQLLRALGGPLDGGAPVDGTTWRGNFCRDWTSVKKTKRATSWAHVGGMFHNPAGFGDLYFHRESPFFQLKGFGDLPAGQVAVEGIVSPLADGAIDLEEWVAWVQMSEVHPAPPCYKPLLASQRLLVYGG